MFVVFEGIDGAGKGTQLQLAAAYLESCLGRTQVLSTRMPGGTELGMNLRELLFHTVTSKHMQPLVADALLLADFLQTVQGVIRPALSAGKVVLCDRYFYSNFAYSVVREKSDLLHKVWQSYAAVPDLVFLLTGDPKTFLLRAAARAGRDGAEKQNGKSWLQLESMTQIQEAYRTILQPYVTSVEVPVGDLSAQEVFTRYIQPRLDAELADRAERTEEWHVINRTL